MNKYHSARICYLFPLLVDWVFCCISHCYTPHSHSTPLQIPFVNSGNSQQPPPRLWSTIHRAIHTVKVNWLIMYNLPSPEVVASWPAPSKHPDSHAYIVIVVMTVFSVILMVVVGLRVLSRIFISKTFTVDDWMIVSAYVRPTICH
jgi:hypothetical protein